jgi:hypothetical protein
MWKTRAAGFPSECGQVGNRAPQRGGERGRSRAVFHLSTRAALSTAPILRKRSRALYVRARSESARGGSARGGSARGDSARGRSREVARREVARAKWLGARSLARSGSARGRSARWLGEVARRERTQRDARVLRTDGKPASTRSEPHDALDACALCANGAHELHFRRRKRRSAARCPNALASGRPSAPGAGSDGAAAGSRARCFPSSAAIREPRGAAHPEEGIAHPGAPPLSPSHEGRRA